MNHLGSTGKYVRMALRENMIGMAMGGRSTALKYNYDQTIQGMLQGDPPVTFGMPSGPDHPPFMLDMGASIPWDEDTFMKMPQVYFKAIGIAFVGNILSGTLSGMMLPEFQKENTKYDARRGESGFFLALDIERFTSLQAFRDDMDHLMDEVAKMKPFPGYDRSELPGGPEWRLEKEYRKSGVPLRADVTRSLEKLADEYSVPVPWSRDWDKAR
jgi:LDH2 family malate/lactate/ureidoglycolate dehydrogenase